MGNCLLFYPFSKERFTFSKRWLPISFFLLLWFEGYGQQMTLSRQLVFEKIGKQRANTFLEDSYGFIWIGAGSLFRYDGYAIQKYRPKLKDSSQNSTGTVYALLEDAKKRIWIGAANGLFHYDRERDELIEHPIEGRENAKTFGRTISLLQDKSGRLWIGDRQRLYLMENPDSNSFKIIKGIQLGRRLQGALGVLSIVEGKKGEIFASTNNGLWLIRNDTVEQLLPKEWQDRIEEFQILDAAKDYQDRLWLATIDGLWLFDMQNASFSKKELPAETGKVVKKVRFGKLNELWIGSQDAGLFKYENGSFEQFKYEPNNPYSLYDNDITALTSDRFNNLWVGTFIGINRINFERQKFPFYQIAPGPYNYDNYTHRVLQDSLDGFWFRLLKLGLGHASRLEKSYGLEEELDTLLRPESGSIGEEVKSFCVDPDGNVWVITLTKGLYKFEKSQKEPKHIDLGDFMKSAYTLEIISDRKNPQYLWFTSRFGLCRVNRFTHDTKCFAPRDDLIWVDTIGVADLDQSEDGNFWCSIKYKGFSRIIYFDYNDTTFIAKPNDLDHPSSIKYTWTNHIKSMPGNQIWVGTGSKGVIIIDAKEKTYRHLTEKEGLPVKSVMSIAPDKEGNIWFTSPGKICKVMKFAGRNSTYDWKNYRCYDNIEDIESFTYRSAAVGKDGRITFGGRNGVYSFYPNEIAFDSDTVHPKVYLTNFKVLNKKRPLEKAYELIKEIRLPFKENEIIFEFAALDFFHTKKIRYKYRLIGQDKAWKESGGERQAFYNNLKPRMYTFQVLASNVDSSWPAPDSGLNIKVVIVPPWYRSRPAWLLYIVAGAALLLGVRRYELRRQFARAEARRLKELDAVKTRLYTNITHEFRTPLTVIMGVAGKIKKDPPKAIRKLEAYSEMILRNSRGLLRLVTQMLDLSKLEAGAMSLNLSPGDLINFLRYLLESFHSYAETEGVHLEFHSKIDELWAEYDPDKVKKIVSNLVANAIKFTPEGGKIQLAVDLEPPAANCLLLTVSDAGPGIPADQLPYIFDRFYQVDDSSTRKRGRLLSKATAPAEGTGIGLALTKELVKLMKGRISVDSQLGKGTIFKVVLPLTGVPKPTGADKKETASTAMPVQPYFPKPSAYDAPEGAPVENPGKPQLLIIEDNPDVVRYLRLCLEKGFRLQVANDGAKGWAKALETIPDLIISDVMMPETDGFELCKRLKKERLTSHIPIILLTAKADRPSRIAGLERGADAYLAKPFDEQELLVRINKLLDLRRVLQEKYRNLDIFSSPFDPSAVKDKSVAAPITDSPEEAFLMDARQVVLAHLHHHDLDVNKLCRLLNMSRTQLHRKFKALTGLSATRFINSVRLSQAQKLLLNPQLSIKEVAYDAGFKSPNYFRRLFSETFGRPPSEYRAKKLG